MQDSNLALQQRDLELPGGTVPLVEAWAPPGVGQSFETFRRLVDLFAKQESVPVLLREPVDWNELRERLSGRSAENHRLISYHASMPQCVAHSLGVEFSCVRLNDLYRDEPAELVTVDVDGVEVPPDRRLAGIEKGRQLFVRPPNDYPLLIGTDEAIRMLVSSAPGKCPPKIYRARDTRVTYTRFQYLWEGVSAAECFSVESLMSMRHRWSRLLLACGIGKTMGRTHASNMLNGDAHTGNFVIQMLDDATIIDLEDGLTLAPKLSAAQCAADISSLLPEMDRPEWLAFRAGYLYRWPSGKVVIELMEGATAEASVVNEDELALNFARVLSATGDHSHALPLYDRVVTERTERLGPDHTDTRDAAAALLAGTVLARTHSFGDHKPSD